MTAFEIRRDDTRRVQRRHGRENRRPTVVFPGVERVLAKARRGGDSDPRCEAPHGSVCSVRRSCRRLRPGAESRRVATPPHSQWSCSGTGCLEGAAASYLRRCRTPVSNGRPRVKIKAGFPCSSRVRCETHGPPESWRRTNSIAIVMDKARAGDSLGIRDMSRLGRLSLRAGASGMI